MESSLPLKVVTVVGTRPEIIRLSRVIATLDHSKAIDHILIHTGQNYDYTLNEIFFKSGGILAPDILGILSRTSGDNEETSIRCKSTLFSLIRFASIGMGF